MSDLAVIKEIEQIIGKELTLCPFDENIMDWEQRDSYLLNDAGRVVGLNLANCQLKTIDFLKPLTNLTQLSLTSNQLSDITDLSTLTNLTRLDLSDNQLSDIIALSNLINLTELSLFYNQLNDISALSTLTNLTQLSLWNNQLNDISALSALTNLTQLDLSENQLSDITALNTLTNLTQLYLRNNQLSDITALSTLTNLTQLSLFDNQLSDISALSTLSNLTQLSLFDNQLSDISALSTLSNLTRLGLSFNKIKKIPELLLDFNLTIKWEHWDDEHGIYVIGNPLEEPPLEIVALGNQAIKQYFDAGERRAINELKVILVGSGGAGKTSLSKVLRNELFDNNENQTHGINIYKHCLGDININFWDFGGQEMQHATHQFFLSKRSVYILVLDDRKEDNAEYWLKYIESFGGNSPILVVLNKTDDPTKNSYDVDRRRLKDKYEGIQDFYKLSCKTGRGLAEFKTGLLQAFTKVSLIRSQLPNTWLDLKTHLENLPAETNFIDYQFYRQLCAERQIHDSQTQDVLAQYLNDLGAIIHFTDPQLMGTPVLKPCWITQAIYKIIYFKEKKEVHGLFCTDDLPLVLKKHSDTDFYYPPEKYPLITDLMKKFEICYQADDKHILIPDLLEKNPDEFQFNMDNVLRFRIRYNFLSRLIMPRFIVNLHSDIKDELRWLTGVVLEDKDLDARALVTVDYEEKLIDIIVNGSQKRDYFATIRKTFYKIHKGFDAEKFKFDEFVPLPDYPSYEVDYLLLIRYEKKAYLNILNIKQKNIIAFLIY